MQAATGGCPSISGQEAMTRKVLLKVVLNEIGNPVIPLPHHIFTIHPLINLGLNESQFEDFINVSQANKNL